MKRAAIKNPLLFHLDPGDDLLAFEQHLGRLEQDAARSADAYFFVVSNSLLRYLLGTGRAHFLRALFNRGKEKHIGFIAFNSSTTDFRCAFVRRDGTVREVAEPRPIVETTRSHDLADLISEKRKACVLVATPGTHFVTPSGTHCEQFVRVTNAINDLGSLQRIAFWLQPEFLTSDAILVDTWGLVSVVLETMRLVGLSLPYEALTSHAVADPVASVRRLERLFRTVGRAGRILFLQSIRGGGHLTREIREEAARIGIPEAGIHCLDLFQFAGADTGTPCLAKIPQEGRTFTREQPCGLCEQGLELVEIDPQLYYVATAAETPVPLGPVCWETSKPFFNAYHDCTGVFRFHADHPHDARHHAFYIDAGKLVESPAFQSRLEAKIQEIDERLDLIVSPAHEAGKKLAKSVSKFTGTRHLSSENLRHETLSPEGLEWVRKAKSILFIDDVAITGTRIGDYLCALRESYTKDEIAGKRIHFLVAVARPPSEKAWQRICASCTNHNLLQVSCNYVERLFLPNWGQQHCPWCREFDFLTACAGKMPRVPDWLRERAHQLSDKAAGVVDNPLWLPPGFETPKLGLDALACTHKMDATPTMFSVAAALQFLRNHSDPKSMLRPGFPVSHVFNVESFQNYGEGLVRAAILRGLSRDEFPARDRKKTRDYLVSKVQGIHDGIALGELVLAMGGGAVLPPNRAHWDKLLQPFGDGFVQSAADVLQIRM